MIVEQHVMFTIIQAMSQPVTVLLWPASKRLQWGHSSELVVRSIISICCNPIASPDQEQVHSLDAGPVGIHVPT